MTPVRALLLAALLVSPAPSPAGTSSAPPRVAPVAASSDEAAIARTVDDSIGWFRTKDFDLLFRVHSPGPDLFLFQPDSTDTVTSGEAFRTFAEVFRRPGFTYLRHEVKELRIRRARAEDVAWFSARLDDCATIDGRVGCWKDARWTGVVEKRAGRWVIVQAHFSLAADPARVAVPPEAAREGAARATNRIEPAGRRPEIEAVIRASFSWARTKDTALLFGTRAQDEDLFVQGPYASGPLVGFEAFRARAKELWLRDGFAATGYDVRELRIHVSPKGTVAWFSAVVDDWCEVDGRPDGWKDVRWTGVLEVRGAAWRYVQGHFSYASDRPAPPPAAR